MGKEWKEKHYLKHTQCLLSHKPTTHKGRAFENEYKLNDPLRNCYTRCVQKVSDLCS